MAINHFASNPRQISKKEHARLEKDLSDLGDLGGICHDLDTNSLIGGNQRSEIMGVISGANVPIVTERFDPPTKQGTVALGYIEWRGEKYAYRAVKGWTDEQRRRANIEANRAGGAWDVDVLANDWDAKELISFGFDEDWLREQGKMYGAVLNMLEAEKPEPVDAEPQIDRAAELNEKWQVKRGDLWQIGEHRLLCGDSTVRADVERVMGVEKANLMVTSPPYNSGNAGMKYDYYGEKKEFYSDRTIDKKTKDDWITFCDSVMNLFNEISANEEAVIFLNVMYNANMRDAYGLQVFGDGHEFTVKETICWNKKVGFNISTSGIFSRNWELCFVLSVGKKYFTTQKENESRLAMIEINPAGSQIAEHHAAYPVELAEKAIEFFSLPFFISYEPFAGTGTTLVACQNLSRKCRAIEISENYCAVILQRMSDAFPGIEIKRIE